MCPGAILSDSTAIVAAMTFSAPYFDRRRGMWSVPFSSGTIAFTNSGLVSAARAKSSCVAFTVIQSTSAGGTSATRETGTLKFPNALSRRSCSGYWASEPGLTTSVTEAPDRARHAPIRPPTPPAPRIACRKGWGIPSLFGRGDADALQDLRIGEGVVALLGALVDAVYHAVGGFDPVALQPEKNIRFPAHGADVNNLIQPENVRGHAGIDGVGQHDVILVIGLDDRGRVHAGGGAESVVTDHGIIFRNGHAGRARNSLTICLQLGQVLLVPGRNAHQFQIHQHLVNLGVAHALAQTDGAAVHTIRARDDRGHGVGDGEAAIAVAVPVHANLFARGLNDFLDHKAHQSQRAHRSGVAGGVANADGPRAAVDGGGIEALHRLRIATAGVFGDVHHVETE